MLHYAVVFFVVAIIAGADLAYVVSHHLLRMVLVILLGPVVEKVIARRERGGRNDPDRTP